MNTFDWLDDEFVYEQADLPKIHVPVGDEAILSKVSYFEHIGLFEIIERLSASAIEGVEISKFALQLMDSNDTYLITTTLPEYFAREVAGIISSLRRYEVSYMRDSISQRVTRVFDIDWKLFEMISCI